MAKTIREMYDDALKLSDKELSNELQKKQAIFAVSKMVTRKHCNNVALKEIIDEINKEYPK